MKKKRKINMQKIFSFASFIFIIVCILWYGGRFIYFYQSSKKIITEEANTIARTLKTQNHDQETFKQYHTTYYFYKNATNNYLTYSNILWRVVKINEDNSVVLISDQVLSNLAYGEEETNYSDSSIIKWFNSNSEEQRGILEKNLAKKEGYLVKNTTCLDTVDDMKNITCNDTTQDYYIGLLSVDDYINTGGQDSFINNGRYTYLSNQNKEHQIWYINEEGKLDTTSGTDIMGVKAVITLSPTLELQGGTGTQEDPYKIDTENHLFGSYVKLGEDIWRVYEEQENLVKLILNDYIKVNEEKLQYAYSKSGYYHNDTIYGSLAYYLNHTYLNQLSYKDLIVENKYSNGYYGVDSNYDYISSLEETINTKVALPSIGDIILNDTLDNYFTLTGNSKDSSLVYVEKEQGTISVKSVTTEQNVVPCISIKKDSLKVGSGVLNDPYRTE